MKKLKILILLMLPVASVAGSLDDNTIKHVQKENCNTCAVYKSERHCLTEHVKPTSHSNPYIKSIADISVGLLITIFLICLIVILLNLL